jgi:glycerate-2-kinase
VDVIDAPTSGEARLAGIAFAGRGLGPATRGAGRRRCVIASGETTVTVAGSGRGGRNLEFALSAVEKLERCGARGEVALLASAGTDGMDGTTDAAGAIVDTTTGGRARAANLDAGESLEANASYDYFAALGDLLVWGPTGTNVGDVHVLLTG